MTLESLLDVINVAAHTTADIKGISVLVYVTCAAAQFSVYVRNNVRLGTDFIYLFLACVYWFLGQTFHYSSTTTTQKHFGNDSLIS